MLGNIFQPSAESAETEREKNMFSNITNKSNLESFIEQ